jgi:multidrug transporter EmrE-like cation transporter
LFELVAQGGLKIVQQSRREIMKTTILTFLLASVSLLSQATVTQINTSLSSSQLVFKDSTTGLTWTNANAFSSSGLTYDAATTAVDALTLAGISTWRLPSLADGS